MLHSVIKWLKGNKLVREMVALIFIKYIKLIAKPKEKQIIIVTLHGIGDTYIMCALSQQICEAYNVDSIIMFVQKSHKTIPEIFPGKISGVFTLNKNCKRLINRIHLNMKNNIILDSRDEETVTRFNEVGINLLQYIGRNLKISLNSELLKPEIGKSLISNAKVWFDLNDIVYKKTIILFPQSNSIVELSYEIWDILAGRLNDLGYQLYTNVINDSDKIVLNTKPIIIPLEYCIPISEYAGGVISTRSGICDLLSTANTNLVVLYPENPDPLLKSYLECYSMNSIYSSKTIREFEFNGNNTMPNIEEIIRCFNFE